MHVGIFASFFFFLDFFMFFHFLLFFLLAFLFILFFLVFVFVFSCVSVHFPASLLSGRSKVTRVTVGRDIHQPTNQSFRVCKVNLGTLKVAKKMALQST